MFDQLEKYNNKNHFLLEQGDDLEPVCNAPDLPGVFIVYTLVKGKAELVYIGFSKNELKETPGKRYALEFGTLKEEILEGAIFNKKSIQDAFAKKPGAKSIEALDIYWYVTMDKKIKDFPEDVERVIMQSYIHTFGKLPELNKQLK